MVMRTNIKLLTSYHINGRHNYIPNKTKVDQIMFIAVHGFIPIGNDVFGKGRRCVKVGCVPIGTYENAKRDSFCAEYDEDGIKTYSQIPENMMRVKGQPYW